MNTYIASILAVFMALPQLLHAEDLSHNLIHNGSFEVGMTAEWGRTLSPNGDEPLRSTNIDPTNPFHGHHSLRSDEGEIWTRFYDLEIPGTYVITIALRGPAQTATLYLDGYPKIGRRASIIRNPLKTWEIPVGKAWELHRFEVIPTDKRAMLRLRLPEGAWVDAVSLRRLNNSAPELGATGEEPTTAIDLLGDGAPAKPAFSFVPRSPIEVGFYDDRPGHVFHSDSPIIIPGRVANLTKQTADLSVVCEVRDMDDQVIVDRTLSVKAIAAGQIRDTTLTLTNHPHGLFSLIYYPKGDPEARGEYLYSVVQKPDGRSVAGHNTHLCDYTLAALKAAGLASYASLTDTWIRCSYIVPKDQDPRTAEYTWYDDRVNLLKKYDIEGMLAITPKNYGVWKSETPTTELGRHPNVEPDYPKWDAWVERMARHYGDRFDIYYVGDEIDSGFTPERYVNVVRHARAAIDKGDPGARIIVSASGPFFDRFLAAGGDELIQMLGGSTMGDHGARARKMASAARRYNKQVYSTGGFVSVPSLYRTHGGHIKEMYRSEHFVQETIRTFFEQNADMMYPYIARLTSKTTLHTMMFNHFEWDGSMKSSMTAYMITGMVLGRSKRYDRPIQPVDLPQFQTKRDSYGFKYECFTFLKDGQAGAVMWGDPCALKLPELSGIELRDWLFNPIDIAKNPPHMSRRPFYLLADKETTRDAFLERLAPAPADAQGLMAQAYYRPSKDPDRDVELVVKLDNHSDQEQSAKAYGFGTIAPQAREVHIVPSMKARIDRPLPEHRLGNSKLHAWLSNTPSRPSTTIDGQLYEWQQQSPNTLCVTWDTLRKVGREELQAIQEAEYITHDWGHDYKVYFWTAWSPDSLLLAVRVNDDDIRLDSATGDRLSLTFAPNLIADIEAGTIAPSLPITIALLANGKLALTRGDTTCQWPAIWKPRPGDFGGYDLEIAIPWADIGNSPTVGQVIGFDLTAHDIDGDGRHAEHSILHWAGQSRPAVGQLLLTDEHTR